MPEHELGSRRFGNLKHGLASEYIRWIFQDDGFKVKSLTNSDRIIDGDCREGWAIVKFKDEETAAAAED